MESINADYSLIKKEVKLSKIKLFLSMCSTCGACAESCFIYQKTSDPCSIPSYKVINSIGIMLKKKGNVDDSELNKIKELIWGKCALCRRCYCPFGIDISSMISSARMICRKLGIYENYEKNPKGVNV